MPQTQPLPGHSGHHSVQFYSDSTNLCTTVADFLGDGLAAGQPIVVIAVPAHRSAILLELARRGFDVDRLIASTDLAVLDAGETLGLFMESGVPRPAAFRQVMGLLLETVRKGRHECVVRAYGEMVDVLWRAEQHDAAIRLEVLWNELATEHLFSLLCGYQVGQFFKHAAAIASVCEQHTHSHGRPSPADDDGGPSPAVTTHG